ncbi:hypothetical protein FPV67DRAFT_1190068 [Lyophyllum atratum]|nr:hypothetical protein FPV67DRAFT_1190068 [Lyophyllum atratum]
MSAWDSTSSTVARLSILYNIFLGNILGIVVGAFVNWAHGTVNVIDFYLDDARAKEKQRIVELVGKDDAESAQLLRGSETAIRGLWGEAVVDATIDQGPGLLPMQIKVGDRLRATDRNAHLNPAELSDPPAVNPNRPLASYNLNGTGFHNCLLSNNRRDRQGCFQLEESATVLFTYPQPDLLYA